MAKNKPVPVALFVFNRHKQLQQTLDCLKNSGIELIYVFADGPRSNADTDSIKEVRSIIDGITWAKVVKYYSPKNKGLSTSIRDGLTLVFNSHETAIVIEDDVCVAPEFYDYMKTCLTAYRSNPEIAGITGLRYPFSRKNLDKYPYDAFLTPRFSSWGWATWKDRWQAQSFDDPALIKELTKKRVDLSKGGADIPYAIHELSDGRLKGSWDISFLMNMLLNEQYFVWPKYNLVVNTGLTEGTHASGEGPTWNLKWEDKRKVTATSKLPKTLKLNHLLLADFLDFFLPENLEQKVPHNNSSGNTNKRESSVRYNKTYKRGKTVLKKTIQKAVNTAGYKLTKLPPPSVPIQSTPSKPVEKTKPIKVDPKDYSTTDEPMEVPCQKVVYYYALNNLIKPSDSVLDVGLGLGYGMAILSVNASTVEGVDVDKKAVAYASKEYLGNNPKIKKVSAYDGYNLPYADNSFDVVTCVDVLEHVEDYDRFIKELLRVSKKFVVFGTPNQRPEYTNPDGTPKNHWHLREWKHVELDKIITAHTKKVDWNFINGPFDGPFKISKAPTKDTLVLMPVLSKR